VSDRWIGRLHARWRRGPLDVGARRRVRQPGFGTRCDGGWPNS
jgi:hypothetical protein